MYRNASKGLTLIELLITFTLLSIVIGMIYTGYISILKETSNVYFLAKDEREIRTFMYQLIKDIRTAGFGVGKKELDNTGTGVLSSCQFPTTDVPVIARCEDNNSNDQLFLVSLAARNITEHGCWGFVDSKGCLRVTFNEGTSKEIDLSKNLLGQRCTPNPKGDYLFLGKERNIVGGDVVSNPCTQDATCTSNIRCNGYENSIAIYLGENRNYKYPDSFQIRYYLDNAQYPCVENTYTLYRQLRSGVPQPILSCIAGMKIFYGKVDPLTGNVVYSQAISNSTDPNQQKRDFKNLKSIVICMAVQVGRNKAKKVTDSIRFSDKCGNIVLSFNDKRRFYRWKVIEEEIPLRNIGSITEMRE